MQAEFTHAFPEVKGKSTIVKERTLSFPGKTLVKAGDRVGPSALIAKSDYTSQSARVVDLGAELKTTLSPDMFDQMVLVKPGDAVKRNQPLVRDGRVLSPCDGVVDHVSRLRGHIVLREDASTMKPMEVVRVSEILGFHPRWLRANCLVKEGDFVFEGQVLAGAGEERKSEFAYSPISGVVTRICPKTGTVTIVRPMTSAKVYAYICGEVVKVLGDLGAVIEGRGFTIYGSFGVGGEVYGPAVVLADAPEDVLDERGIDSSVAGKIIVCGAMATRGALEKANSLGAKGLIAGGLNYGDVLRLYHENREEPPLTVILLEGAGFMPPRSGVWQILKENEGKILSMDGTTVLGRDGVRPEIIINDSYEPPSDGTAPPGNSV